MASPGVADGPARPCRSRTLPSAQSPADVRTLAAWTRKASETVEGLYLSPISDDSQTYTTAVVRDLVERYPLDGVHLDYIRYPGAAFDYGAPTLAAFRAAVAPARPAAEQQQLDRAAVKNPAAWADGLPAEFAAFRRDRLTALVRRLQAAVRAARPQAIVSAAVVPDPGPRAPAGCRTGAPGRAPAISTSPVR